MCWLKMHVPNLVAILAVWRVDLQLRGGARTTSTFVANEQPRARLRLRVYLDAYWGYREGPPYRGSLPRSLHQLRVGLYH